MADLLDILASEVNVKTVDVVESDHDLVSLKGKGNFRSLGKRYGKDTPRVVESVGGLSQEQLQALERSETVRVGEWEIAPEDVTITREVASDWLVQADGPYVVALDPHLTPDLEQEGVAREVVNRVQRLRKDAGYEYTTRIELGIAGDADLVRACEAYQDFIAGETLARKTVFGPLPEPDLSKDVEIDGRTVTLAVRRHDARKGNR